MQETPAAIAHRLAEEENETIVELFRLRAQQKLRAQHALTSEGSVHERPNSPEDNHG